MNKIEENNSMVNTSNSDTPNDNGKRTKKRATKKEMYQEEREEIIKDIYKTIKISEENKCFILHDIENSIELKNKINELDEKIKMYFKTGNWNYYIKKNNGKISPIIGLIRALLKDNNIDLTKKDISILVGEKKIRTTKYYLMA